MLKFAAVVALCLGSAFADSNQLLLLQKPTLSKTHIVFGYAGDLWSVPREGGDAQRARRSRRLEKRLRLVGGPYGEGVFRGFAMTQSILFHLVMQRTISRSSVSGGSRHGTTARR